MSRLMLVLISVCISCFIIIKAFWIQLNGHSTIEIINRLPILFAPANYVYMIWYIIFFILFLWCFYYFKNRKTLETISNSQTLLFILATIFQVVSLVNFHNEQFISSFIILALLFITLFLLYLTYPMKKEMLKLRIPISIYFSFVSFLFILHICYVLVTIEWQGFGLSNALWAVIFMTLGVAIALHLRYHHQDIIYPIVFVWCYLGIAIENGFSELLVTIAALFLSGVMIVGVLFIRKNPERI